MLLPNWLQIVFIAMYGLIGGSFASAWLWRLHTNELVSKGRSKCRNCKHTLSWHELLPLVSWVVQKGRCRHCKKKISKLYPLIEATTAVLFVASFIVLQPITGVFSSFEILYWLITLVVLVVLTFYDLLWLELPNKAVAALYVTGVVYVAFDYLNGSADLQLLLNRLLNALFIFAVFYALFSYKDGKYIGGGDVKMLPALGLVLSFERFLFMLLIASVSASIVGITMIILKKQSRNQPIPFGPFLIGSFIIMFLFGPTVVDGYNSLLEQLIIY